MGYVRPTTRRRQPRCALRLTSGAHPLLFSVHRLLRVCSVYTLRFNPHEFAQPLHFLDLLRFLGLLNLLRKPLYLECTTLFLGGPLRVKFFAQFLHVLRFLGLLRKRIHPDNMYHEL